MKRTSHLHGLDESDAKVRLPYILNNLPPYTGPPSHSVLRKSQNHLSDVESNYHLISTSTTTSSTTSSTLAPYIDPTTPTNVTVIRGKTAMLVCVVTDLGTAKVCIKNQSYVIDSNVQSPNNLKLYFVGIMINNDSETIM